MEEFAWAKSGCAEVHDAADDGVCEESSDKEGLFNVQSILGENVSCLMWCYCRCDVLCNAGRDTRGVLCRDKNIKSKEGSSPLWMSGTVGRTESEPSVGIPEAMEWVFDWCTVCRPPPRDTPILNGVDLESGFHDSFVVRAHDGRDFCLSASLKVLSRHGPYAAGADDEDSCFFLRHAAESCLLLEWIESTNAKVL